MGKLSNDGGITLIALIITVVIMLILAGVAISVLTNDSGLFEKTTMSAKEYKKQSIIEIIKSAEFQLEIDARIDNSIEKNITNLLAKISEIGDIDDQNYSIMDNNLDEATIIDKTTGIVFDIKILPNGEVYTDTSIVEDINDIVKPSITYSLDPDVGDYADEVKITINVKESTKGIVKLQFPNNTEKSYNKESDVTEVYTVNKNGIYKFTAEGANGRKISSYIYVRNAMKPADIEMVLLNPVATKEAEIQIIFDNNLPSLTNDNKYQYSIGENNWRRASSNQIIKVTKNETVYARYFDGTMGHKCVSLNITNVDRIAPNEFNLVAKSSFSKIEVSGQTTDAGSEGIADDKVGIRGYQFQLKDNKGKILVDWTTEQSGTTYTFNNLKEETEYSVNMRAIDKAGNVREASNNNYRVNTVKNSILIEQINTGENVTFDGKSVGTYNNPIIPKGFAPINQNGAEWGTPNGYQNGLVIRDSLKNEFVWVPVDGNIVKLQRYNFKNTLYGEETIPQEILNSINSNGGFYIARYEAGKSGNEVVFKKGSNIWNLNWHDSKVKAENMYASSNKNYGIISTLPYAAQWDTALKFIQSYNGDVNYVTDSTGKGNYTGNLKLAGDSDSYMKKNIYDMAGNVLEWNMIMSSNTGVARGGHYKATGSSQPACYHHGDNSSSALWAFGFRITLYIKTNDI